MKKLSELEPELKKIRDEKKKIQADLDIVKKFIDEKEEKISGVKQDSQA
jgi:predicted  nucleic acid-binding Zn-ribbon protein